MVDEVLGEAVEGFFDGRYVQNVCESNGSVTTVVYVAFPMDQLSRRIVPNGKGDYS